MTHWDFLELKLGRDIVRYIIQPMLMPSESQVRRNKKMMLRKLLVYSKGGLGEYFIPSVIEECEEDIKKHLRRTTINRHYW